MESIFRKFHSPRKFLPSSKIRTIIREKEKKEKKIEEEYIPQKSSLCAKRNEGGGGALLGYVVIARD